MFVLPGSVLLMFALRFSPASGDALNNITTSKVKAQGTPINQTAHAWFFIYLLLF